MLEINNKAARVFHFFEEIAAIPHGSGNTAPIADYLQDFAEKRGLVFIRDKKDNVVIKKPATEGFENRPTVIIQGHTDMVAEKVAGLDKDMTKEGLDLYVDGDLLKARGTTLGGDDGVAVAYALALLDSRDIPHPPLEALFTSDEEIGLLGAVALDTSVLDGQMMINIDSDVEGIFTVGCAGGVRCDIKLPIERDQSGGEAYSLKLSGLKGGHSGMEIDKGRENALKLLSEIIKTAGCRLIGINGGNADNAIPRECEALVSLVKGDKEALEAAADEVIARVNCNETEISFSMNAASIELCPLTKTASDKALALLCELPSGVIAMSRDIEGLVETSLNMGIVRTEDGFVSASFSVRSSKGAEKAALISRLHGIADSYGASALEHGDYPAWEYKAQSHLCDVMTEVYTRSYGKAPEVLIIHAGLECGIFSEKIEGLECVSIGPDNFDIHTTEERLSISSTERVWCFLLDVLKEI